MAVSRTRKLSEYGEQLQEKQRLRQTYGLREAQFRRYFKDAAKHRGNTATELLKSLERRLDNVVFRAGLAQTRRHARQLINHRRIMLNGKRVNAPSITVIKGDVIEPYKKSGFEIRADITKTEWLKVDKKTLKITVIDLPKQADLPTEFDIQKIVEFYSR